MRKVVKNQSHNHILPDCLFFRFSAIIIKGLWVGNWPVAVKLAYTDYLGKPRTWLNFLDSFVLFCRYM